MKKWFDTVLEHRRFSDLEAPLSIVALDIETGRPFVFSRELTPDASLAVAVRCSASIPGVFAIRRHNNHTLVDGALAHIDESDLFADPDRPLVTIRLVRDRLAERSAVHGRFGLSAYIMRLASLMLDAVDRARVASGLWKNTLLIDTGPFSSINFELSEVDKQTLYNLGYEQARQYLDLEAIPTQQVQKVNS